MKTIHHISDIKDWSSSFKINFPQKKIAFIPTMGCLHEGHLSLIKKAKSITNTIVVSIFVNPLQFNNSTDFQQYPNTLEEDIKLLEKQKIDILFLPLKKEIYPTYPPKTNISIPSISKFLCGRYREEHFEGVLYIVHNLFMWVQPHCAIFGLKDYQQYQIIQQMVEDLSFPIKIIPVDTIREKDGLAMSSRNKNLTSQNRKKASILYQTLSEVKQSWKQSPSVLEAYTILKKNLCEYSIEYAGLYHPITLEEIVCPTSTGNKEVLLPNKILVAIAANFGDVRLIDNILL